MVERIVDLVKEKLYDLVMKMAGPRFRKSILGAKTFEFLTHDHASYRASIYPTGAQLDLPLSRGGHDYNILRPYVYPSPDHPLIVDPTIGYDSSSHAHTHSISPAYQGNNILSSQTLAANGGQAWSTTSWRLAPGSGSDIIQAGDTMWWGSSSGTYVPYQNPVIVPVGVGSATTTATVTTTFDWSPLAIAKRLAEAAVPGDQLAMPYLDTLLTNYLYSTDAGGSWSTSVWPIVHDCTVSPSPTDYGYTYTITYGNGNWIAGKNGVTA